MQQELEEEEQLEEEEEQLEEEEEQDHQQPPSHPLLQTYPKVDIGILLDANDTTQGILNWCSKNIFIRQDYEDETNLRIFPVSACYGNVAGTSSTPRYLSLRQICSRFKVPFDSQYESSDEHNGLLLKPIMSSFVMDKLFKSNIYGQVTYDSNR